MYDGYLGRAMHGGFCCGMTHFQGFSHRPSLTFPARPRKTPAEWKEFLKHLPGYIHVMNDDCPAETGEERLKRLIEYTTKPIPNVSSGRSKGIIEAVLTADQRNNWHHCLVKNGFKEVTVGVNSNTGHTLSVYHLVTGQ